MKYPKPKNEFQALAGIRLILQYKITIGKEEKEQINKCLDILEKVYFSKEESLIKKGCRKLIYKNDTIKCGEWSGGDQHFCKDCFSTESVKENKHE